MKESVYRSASPEKQELATKPSPLRLPLLIMAVALLNTFALVGLPTGVYHAATYLGVPSPGSGYLGALAFIIFAGGEIFAGIVYAEELAAERKQKGRE